jgi:hypothetical protein
MDQMSKIIGMKSMLGQQQIQQQQSVALGQENTLRAQQIKDQQLLMKAYMDADGDLDKTAALAPKYGVSMQGMTQLQQTVMGVKEARAKLTDQELKNSQTKNDALVGYLQPVMNMDPAQRPAGWSAAAKHASDNGIITPQEFQQVQNYPGDSQAQMYLLQHKTGSMQDAEAMKLREVQAAEQASGARATAAKFKDVNGVLYDVSGATPKPALPQTANSGDWDKLVDSIAPPDKNATLNARTKAEVNFNLGRNDITSAQLAVRWTGQKVGSLEKTAIEQAATNARESLNRQASTQNQIGKQGIDQLDHMFFDPQHGYAQFISQANMTKSTIASAKNGDQLASSLAPLMTALGITSFAGIHRINDTEVNSAGPEVGSLLRRTNAVLDRAVSGTLPADTLKEMGGIVDGLIAAKHSAVVASAQGLAKNTGLDTSKVVMPTRDGNSYDTIDNVAKKSTAPSSGAFNVNDPTGQTHYFDSQAQLDEFKKRAHLQ